jgi:hypothetical protein
MDSLSCANSPSAYASYDVLVHQLADLLAASSRQILADLPLPFASSYHLIAILTAKDGDLPTEDFHLISSCPCWAYTNQATRTPQAAPVLEALCSENDLANEY